MLIILSYLLSGNFIGSISYVLSAAVIIFLLMPIHEYAHARTAYALGDPTAKNMGRLTLNPLHHIDWLGAVFIMILGFGWAKPVPINARYFEKPKYGMAITALAGPVSNLIMAFIACFFMHLSSYLFVSAGLLVARSSSILYIASSTGSVIAMLIYQFFYFLSVTNIALAIFNFIPVPPLDGSRLLTALLPDRIYYKIMQYERYIMLALMVLIIFRWLSTPINYLTNLVFGGFNRLWTLVFGI